MHFFSLRTVTFSSAAIALSFPAGALIAAAPSVVPLEAIVAEVVARNPELQFYEAEIDAAKTGRRSAGVLANPEVSLEAGRKRVRELGGTLAREGTAWSVSVSQTFEWPGRLALRKSIANRQVELAELGLERFKNAIAARARVLGYGLHAAAEKAAVTREVAERYQALREVFLARDPAGMTPLLETRVIEAQELALKRRASEAEIAHRSALRELNALRGAPLAATLQIERPTLAFPALGERAALFATARDRNFQFRLKRLELEQQGLELSLARHERYPALTVSPYFSRENAGDRETTAGIGISVPLPLSSKARYGVDLAEVRRRQAQVALQVAQRDLERELLTAADAYDVKVAEVRSWAPDAVQKFRESAELADRHYRLGAVPLGTYVELQAAYLDAVEALLDTQREALEAGLKVEELSGQRLGGTEAQP